MGAGSNSEWSRGGSLLLTASILNGIIALHGTILGALVEPLQAAFGWGRGQITLPYLFVGLSGLIINPIAGLWIARYGARPVALIGLCLVAIAAAAQGLAGPAMWTWFAAWALYALVLPFANVVVWSTPVVRAFDRYRGMALGLMASTTGIAHAIGPTLVIFCLTFWDWRSAFFAFALLIAVIALPIAHLFFRERPRPSGRANIEQSFAAESVVEEYGSTFASGLKDRRFWQLAAAMMIAGFSIAALSIHLQPMFIDAGASRTKAAAMMSATGVAMIGGRLVFGMMLDRLSGPVVGVTAQMLPLAAVAIMLNYDGSTVAGVVAAVAVGIAMGAEFDILAYFTSRYFGMRNYAPISGILLGSYAVGYTGSPAIAGKTFDVFNSYDNYLYMIFVLSLIGCILISTLGRYVFPENVIKKSQ